MKHKISITLATLAACAFTLPAFASSYSDLMDRTTVKVGLNFTEADGHGTDYLYSPSNCSCSTGNDYKRINSLHPDSHFDWSIGVAYRLNCSNTSFVVEYDQFKDSTRVNTTTDSAANYAYALGTVAINIPVKASVRYDEQDWKFGFRHAMNHGCADVVLGALLEYAQVDREFNNKAVDDTNGSLCARERVKGWGPAFDIDTTVKLCGTKQHAINAFAHLGVALLRTDNDYSQTVWNNAGTAITPAYSFCGERTHSVVSKLDMAIGLGWKCAMTCCPDIAVRAGVKYLNYSNLFKSGSVHLGTALAANAVLPERAVGDYGRFGPFVEFSIGGAKA